jgi:hypothetical protein
MYYTCILGFLKDMDLSKRFQDATSSQIIGISSLDIDRKYHIVMAERVVTKFGPTVLLSIKDSPYNIVKCFAPRHYSCIFTEEDINCINSQKIKFYF